MAQIKGSICASCYANKGFYRMYESTILPVQMARLASLDDDHWVDAMVSIIGSDEYFRWHDSGDLQSVAHLRQIAQVCEATPNCKHWLPTREYAMVKKYIVTFGALPGNLTLRLSAMYPDVAVRKPLSLVGVDNITTSNVHKNNAPIGAACNAPNQGGECLECRMCWTNTVVSYAMH